MKLKSLNTLLVSSILFFGCSKIDDACIDMPESVFVGDEIVLYCCSDSDDYVIWEFENDEAKLGERVNHVFKDFGVQTVKQTVYSDDGRKSHTTDQQISVGLMKVDSVVVTFINTFGHVFENSLPDIYIRLNGIRSNETYLNTADSVVPRLYTFPSELFATSAVVDIYDYNENSNDQHLNNNLDYVAAPNRETLESPIVLDRSTDRFRMEVYWSFITSK